MFRHYSSKGIKEKKKENIFDVATICSPVCTEREFGE